LGTTIWNLSIVSRREEVQNNVPRVDFTAFDSSAYAVQNVITMRFDDHLNPSLCNFGKELSDESLPGGVQVHFWILNQQQITFFRCKCRNNDGQNLRKSEPDVDRTMKVGVVASSYA